MTETTKAHGKHETEAAAQTRLLRRILDVVNVECLFVILTFVLMALDIVHHWNA